MAKLAKYLAYTTLVVSLLYPFEILRRGTRELKEEVRGLNESIENLDRATYELNESLIRLKSNLEGLVEQHKGELGHH